MRFQGRESFKLNDSKNRATLIAIFRLFFPALQRGPSRKNSEIQKKKLNYVIRNQKQGKLFQNRPLHFFLNISPHSRIHFLFIKIQFMGKAGQQADR